MKTIQKRCHTIVAFSLKTISFQYSCRRVALFNTSHHREQVICKFGSQFYHQTFQAISGNDQNASPTNKKTAGSKLDRTT